MQKIRAISSLIQNFMDILSKVFEQWHAHRHKDVQCEFVSSLTAMRSHLNTGEQEVGGNGQLNAVRQVEAAKTPQL